MPTEVNHAYNTLATDIEEFEKDIHATINNNLQVVIKIIKKIY